MKHETILSGGEMNDGSVLVPYPMERKIQVSHKKAGRLAKWTFTKSWSTRRKDCDEEQRVRTTTGNNSFFKKKEDVLAEVNVRLVVTGASESDVVVLETKHAFH